MKEPWIYLIDEEINDKFAPYMPLTHVWTTAPNEVTREEISRDLWHARMWGIKGMAVDNMEDKEEWFEVLHEDGSTGNYHYTELKLWSNDESGGDEDNYDPPFEPDDAPLLELQNA